MGDEATKAAAAIEAALSRTTDVPAHQAMTKLRDAILKGRDDHASFKQPGDVAEEFERYATEIASLRGPLINSKR